MSLLLAASVAREFHSTIGAVALLGLLTLAVINASNFMDGINGITGLHGIVWGLAYALLFSTAGQAQWALASMLLTACCIGFLPWNFPRAQIFLGDSGSYLIGAMVSALAMAAVLNGRYVAAVAPLAIYATDTLSTLLKRVKDGHSPLAPHRDHIYQQLAARFSPTTSALVVAGASTVCACFGLGSLVLPKGLVPLAAVPIVILCIGYLLGSRVALAAQTPSATGR